MSVPLGGRDATQIAEHLLAGLTVDARRAYVSLFGEAEGQVGLGHLHDTLHRRLGAVRRSLRHTKVGVPVHAACVRLPDGRGVLLAGRTGAGKSTLATMLGVTMGAEAISDDTVWVTGRRAVSLGAPVAVRPRSPLRERASALWYADDSERLLAQATDLGVPSTSSSGPVDLLLVPTYARGDAALTLMSPAEIFCRLVESVVRTSSPAELDSLAHLAAGLPAAAVSYPDTATSLDLCAQFFDAASERRTVEPARISDEERLRSGLCRDVEGIRFGGEVALWRSPGVRLVHLRGWSGETLWQTPAEQQLVDMGFLERKGA